MSYAEEAAAVSGMSEDERQARGMCCVRGCPLPGGIADGTLGSRDWFCRVHHGAAYSEQAGMTNRIANRRSLYTLAVRLSNAPVALLVPPPTLAWLVARGREQIALTVDQNGPLTCRRLAAALFSAVDFECRDPQERVPVDQPKTVAPQPFDFTRNLG